MSDQTPYQRWYEKHKADLAVRRAERYRDDPTYREACRKRSQAARRAVRERVPAPPEGSLGLQPTCDVIGVSSFVLASWRTRGLIPEPGSYLGRFYFTPPQVQLLKLLAKFFKTTGFHLTKKQRDDLSKLSDYITVNW